MKRGLLILIVVILVFSLASCNFPLAGGQSGSDSAVKTAVALSVALTQLAATQAAVITPAQSTPDLPTALPATALPTATLPPTMTPTLAGVWLTVLENTNCRSGPGTMYDWVTLISAGQTVEALARNPVNDYYYVRNPNSSSGFCWLWSQYSSVSGNITTLPVFTPQPTPTLASPTPAADLSINYEGLESCAPQYALLFKIKNTGDITWQSIKIVIKDNTTSTTFTHQSDVFKGVSGCDFTASQNDLTKGEESYVANVNPGQFDYDPTGHSLKVTITVYAKDGLTGTSFSKTISVTP